MLGTSHGMWAVFELRPGGRAELRYAPFDEQGRLLVAPLTIGEFASAGDARFAADAYEAEEPPALPDDLADTLFPGGGEVEILAPGGCAFLLSLSEEAVTLSHPEGDVRIEWARLNQPRTSGDGPEYARPPGHEEPAELDLAIMLRLVNLLTAQ
ncbi:hypothetical protein [Teichococcus vastitatis]|uniref:hypothetical protein n=1 Tax=Teichococcus vastitatis TaxID=2307076 RepID=UPI00130048D5|nr:hypothetical protein [Pseudoroseomonas vastitatis]